MNYPDKWKLADIEEALSYFYKLEAIADNSLFSRDQQVTIQIAIEAIELYQERITEQIQNEPRKF